MNKMLIPAMVALLSIPQFAHAQAYRCKQPNGSTAFQDRPCAAGTSGSTIDLTPAQGYSSDDATQPSGQQEAHAQRYAGQSGGDASAQIDAANARIDAENRRTRCAQAEHDLGVLKEERPVYHYDKNGNKIYVEDSARPAAVAAAQQRVAAACN